MPCYDWCYKTGDINSELLGANVITEDFTKPTTETFFSNNTTNIDKRWKVVSFKSLKDIKQHIARVRTEGIHYDYPNSLISYDLIPTFDLCE